MEKNARTEINQKIRFSFGANWASFLKTLTEERIVEAEKSLLNMLGESSLAGKKFLDAGSGSGLFSLAARRLGATVYSFDYDPDSTLCTQELKNRYFADDEQWTVSEGNVLDFQWLTTLGQSDIVYSWGVLHHTGAMLEAMGNVAELVVPGGILFISIYNDQGTRSKIWRWVKRKYNSGSFISKTIIFAAYGFLVSSLWIVHGTFLHANPFYNWQEYKRKRGMSVFHDWADWVGGYPFEFARPEDIFEFYSKKGFLLEKLTTQGRGSGCNQFVFRKS